MGRGASSTVAGSSAIDQTLVQRFAELIHRRYSAQLYLFGSRARGHARPDSDYDLVAVGALFADQPVLRRAPDRRELWLAAGGWRIALDLQCLTSEEFASELRGLGCLGQAQARGQLMPVSRVPSFD